VALQDSKLRTKAELLRFVRANMDPAVRYRPYQAYCWTRVGYVLGDVFPFVAGIPPAVQERLQDSYDDEIWRRSLEDIVTTLSDPLPAFAGDTQWLDDLARGLNEGKFAHANEVTSFRTVYEAELWGIVECYSDEFASLLAYVHASSGSRARPPTESAKIEGGRLFRNLVFHALRLGKAHTELPTFHITASIHAAMRWDRQRRFRPNDWLDFKHAGAALPLCDMFLTDAFLAQLLQSGPPRLAEVYGVSVVSDPAAALRLLRQLQ
jgi:hypothetical protein